MDSYNLTNGQHMSQNGYFLTDVLKKEWGFDGLVMSDWSATYDGIEATNAGQDLEMPSGLHMNRETLKSAIEQGKVSNTIRQSTSYRQHGDTLWLVGSRADGFGCSALQRAVAKGRARCRARGNHPPEERR